MSDLSRAGLALVVVALAASTAVATSYPSPRPYSEVSSDEKFILVMADWQWRDGYERAKLRAGGPDKVEGL